MRALLFIPFILLVSTSAVAQMPEFVVDALIELPGGASDARRVSEIDASDLSWVVAGSSINEFGVQRPGVWTFTDASDLAFLTPPPLDPTKDSWANAAGARTDGANIINYLVAGVSIDGSNQRKPVLWSMTPPDSEFGVPQVLPTLAGGTGSATSFMYTLDTLGVVGWSDDGLADRAVFWEVGPLGPPTVVPLPDDGPGSTGSATSLGVVDLSVAVCGWSTDAQGDTIPRFWKSTNGGATWTMKQLPLLPGSGWGRADRLVTGDSIWCYVVGSSATAGGMHRAVLWQSPDAGENWTVTPLAPAGGLPNSESFAGTTAGDLGIRTSAPALAAVGPPMRPLFIVGRSYGAGAEVATLWVVNLTETIAYDLNTRVSGVSPYVLRKATGAYLGPHDGTLTICGVGADFAAHQGTASTALPPGQHAWIAQSATPTGIEPRPTQPPRRLFVSASPNPFSDVVSVTFDLPNASTYRLSVYDASGRRVAVLAKGTRESGGHRTVWDGRGHDGQPVSAGVYFVRLEAAGRIGTAKIVLIH